MKKIVSLAFALLMCVSTGSCSNNKNHASNSDNTNMIEYGSVSISNIEILKNKPIQIQPVFSNPSFKEKLEYSFKGQNISIDDEFITGLVENTETEVEAKSAHFHTTFKVKVSSSRQYYGTLKIDNVFLKVNETHDINPVFSRQDRAENLSYYFEGNNISISDGKVTGLVGDTTTSVLAKSKNFSYEFTVSVSEDFELNLLNNAYTYLNYWSLLPLKDNEGNDVTYTSNSDAIEIVGNKIIGKKEGTALVNANYGNNKKRFSFEIRSHSTPDDDAPHDKRYLSFQDDVQRLAIVKDGLQHFEHDEGELTLVFGDSFTDDRIFLKDFYTTRFGMKNAYTVGASGSRSSQWKWWVEDFVQYYPKNVVMHIGTNDLFTDCSVDGIIKNIETIFTRLHSECPNTNIYWWTIEQRIGQAYKNFDIKYINDAIYEYASGRDYLSVIDTYTIMSKKDGSPDVDMYMVGDSVHPRCPECYDKMFEATMDAGLEISSNSKAGRIADRIVPNSSYINATSHAIPLASGNFLYEAQITVNSYYTNPHISFEFNYDAGNRFLIWDSNSDGLFNFGGACQGNYVSESKNTIKLATGTSFKVDILKVDLNAFMFINGVLQTIFAGVPNLQQNFTIGGCGIGYSLTNQAISKEDFNSSLYDAYSSKSEVIDFISSSSLSGTVLSPSSNGGSFGIIDPNSLINSYPMGEGLSADIVGADGYGGPTREYYFYVNGNNRFVGDFAVSYEIEYKNHRGNGFVGVNCSSFGSYRIWGEYHLFYQAISDFSPLFKIHSDYGSQCAQPSVTNGASQPSTSLNYTKLTAFVVRQGNNLFISYKVNDGGNDVYYTSTNAINFDDAAVWLSIGNMEAVFQNFEYTFDQNIVQNIVNLIDNK